MRDDRVRYLADNMDRLSRRDRVFLNNPVIMQGLGLAPVVVPATNIQNALVLATAVALLLTPTRMLATFFGQRVGLKLRAIIYALTAGLLFMGVGYLIDIWFGTAAASVGIYLPMLVLEPLILKRYESPKSERLSTSFKKGIITTLGFCVVLFLMAGLRELLATGRLAGIFVFNGGLLPIAELPVGGFLLLGVVAALWRGLVNIFKKRVSMGVRDIQ